MLDIEYYDASGRVPIRGDELLSDLQDTTTPSLDLLIRESIQNSLDARLDDQVGEKVTVDFFVNNFDSDALADRLDGISSILKSRFSDDYNCLIIRDKGTLGLTGEIDQDKVDDSEDLGNLLKLIYNIRKSKTSLDDQESGGSWGLGKTIYNRVGIGLVFYYSQIYDKDNCSYCERLAGVMIEDPTLNTAILPKYKKRRSGIAWWGRKVSENKTLPLTEKEHEEIHSLLEIFGVDNYKSGETGTMIIIPYINGEALLEEAKKWVLNDDEDSKTEVSAIDCNWFSLLEDYIRVAVRRWYYPRLNNTYYKYGRFLEVFINGKQLKVTVPLFEILQSLYNRAIYGSSLPNGYQDVISQNSYFVSGNSVRNMNTFGVEKVGYKINRKGLKSKYLGTVAYAKVNKEILGMTSMPHFSNPYAYTFLNNAAKNSPIAAFCRKPGMIIWYANEEAYMKTIDFSEGEDYIIAQFVLNSDNSFDSKESLEHYVRATEKGSHRSWDNDPSKIIERIKNSTGETIANAFKNKDSSADTVTNTNVGEWAAEGIIPSFIGDKPSKPIPIKPGTNKPPRKEKLCDIILEEVSYYPEYSINYSVKASSKCKEIDVSLKFASDYVSYTLEDWLKSGFDLPFYVKKVELAFRQPKNYNPISFDLDEDASNSALDGQMNMVNNFYGSGFIISLKGSDKIEFEMKIILEVNSREYKPEISFSFIGQ